jgi:hypothetical protein
MTDRAAQEVEAVKRLLVLLLVKLGASTDEIGLALQVSGQRVRQLVPTKGIKRFAFPETKE